LTAGVPPWFGQQRGSGFSPVDIEFEGESAPDESTPADDVAPGVLGLLAPLVVYFALITTAGLPLLEMIPLFVAGVAWLALGAFSLLKVASSEDFPAWAGVITYLLGRIGWVIKWAVIIFTVVFAVAMVLGIIGAASGGKR